MEDEIDNTELYFDEEYTYRSMIYQQQQDYYKRIKNTIKILCELKT